MAQQNIKQVKGATQGSVLFLGTNGVVSENNSQLYWDNTNFRLGIGNVLPTSKLYIEGTSMGVPLLIASGSSTADLVRITQIGAGNALVVEDSTNPDATPFVVSSDGSVGIGTASPTTKFHIFSTASGSFRLQDSTQGNQFVLISDSNGAGSWITQSSLTGVPNIYNSSGTLSSSRTVALNGNSLTIGSIVISAASNISAATSILTISTIDMGTGGYRFSGDASSRYKRIGSGIQSLDSSGIEMIRLQNATGFFGVGINLSVDPSATFQVKGTTSNATTLLVDGATNSGLFAVLDSGNVGIGTASPTTRLHVSSTTPGAFRLQDTTQGAGYVLVSDANGVGTWQPVPSGGASANNGLTVSGGCVQLGGQLIRDTIITSTYGTTFSFYSPSGYTFSESYRYLFEDYYLSAYDGSNETHIQLAPSYTEIRTTDVNGVLGLVSTVNNMSRLLWEDSVNSYSSHVYAGNTYSGFDFVVGTHSTKIRAYASGQTIADGSTNNRMVIDDSLAYKGLAYAADYTSNYTTFSLIHKGYADSLLGSAITGATNGLYKSGNNVLLGGTLSQATDISNGSFGFRMTSSATNGIRFHHNGTGNTYSTEMLSTGSRLISITTANDILYVSVDDSNAGMQVNINGQFGTQASIKIFNLDQTSGDGSDISTNNRMVVRDDYYNKGLMYYGDYTSNFTNNSLVTKAYVDSNVPVNAATGSGTVNYLARWITTSQLGTGSVYDSGTAVGIATQSNGAYALNVYGDVNIMGTLYAKNAIFSNDVKLNGLTASRMLWMDSNKQVANVTIGNGLSFSSGILSVNGGDIFSGTTNYYTRFASGGTIGDGIIYDNGVSTVSIKGVGDNACLNIISPSGFYYPGLNFYNNGGALQGSITSYANNLYINGGLIVGQYDTLTTQWSAFNSGYGIDTTTTMGTDVLNIGTVKADVINIGRTGSFVGINKTNPSYQLDVNGTMSVSGYGIVNLATGSNNMDAVNVGQLNSATASIYSYIGTLSTGLTQQQVEGLI